tara:strand:- start:290 stop:1108 length:819 start_codon:yes stop_codon:yes gene_type:complete
MNFKIIDDFIEKKDCDILINDLNKFDKKTDQFLIHGGRNSIPITSQNWKNLTEKFSSWKKINDKIFSKDFYHKVFSLIELDEKKYFLSNIIRSKKYSIFENARNDLDKNLRFVSIKRLVLVIIYLSFIKLRISFSFFFNKFFKRKLTIELLGDLSIATKGYSREIHRDSNNRICIFLLFLNEISDEGGKFKFFKYDKKKDFPIRPNIKDCKMINVIEPKPGRLVIFENTLDAYHSVSEMKSQDKRFFMYGAFTKLFNDKKTKKNNTEFNYYF